MKSESVFSLSTIQREVNHWERWQTGSFDIPALPGAFAIVQKDQYGIDGWAIVVWRNGQVHLDLPVFAELLFGFFSPTWPPELGPRPQFP